MRKSEEGPIRMVTMEKNVSREVKTYSIHNAKDNKPNFISPNIGGKVIQMEIVMLEVYHYESDSEVIVWVKPPGTEYARPCYAHRGKIIDIHYDALYPDHESIMEATDNA